jgi:hypothetical protein
VHTYLLRASSGDVGVKICVVGHATAVPALWINHRSAAWNQKEVKHLLGGVACLSGRSDEK